MNISGPTVPFDESTRVYTLHLKEAFNNAISDFYEGLKSATQFLVLDPWAGNRIKNRSEEKIEKILRELQESIRRAEIMKESRRLGQDFSQRQQPRPRLHFGPTSLDRNWMVHRKRNFARTSGIRRKVGIQC